jgi:hypothetical protein
MPRRIPVFPDLPSHIETVELAGTAYRFEFQWRQRLEKWYISVYEDDETPILVGQKIEPGTAPVILRLTLDEVGLIYVIAPFEDYDRADLGDKVQLVHFTPEEVEEL